MSPSRLLPLLLACAPTGCKVPISDVDARFLLADAAWFAEEETLFFFFEVEAEQGLGEESVIEVRYTTDAGVVPWTALADLPQVHAHLAVDCGREVRCGSGSLHVPLEPRDVAVRLRYHREGALSLDAETVFNVVGPGPAHSHRSLLIYGVLSEDNRAVQWRARHRFPTVRNADAERLGLRRRVLIGARGFGAGLRTTDPYQYGGACPAEHVALAWEGLETEQRAIFEPLDLPDAAAEAPMICARSTVFDATGPFEARAVARKNPEVRPAFPVLRSPVRDATPIIYVLSVCDRTISEAHLAMQRQRLQAEGVPAICIDDWMDGGLADELVARFREDIEIVRADGRDMVLAVVLHHDAPALGQEIEAALARTLTEEADRNTPRVAGAFVLDSYAWTILDADVGRTTLWCPARVPLGAEEGEEGELPPSPSTSSFSCAVPPAELPTSLGLGPFDLGVLPILPTRARFLDFIDTFSEAQAGEVTALAYRVPERPATAEHVAVPPFGSATFFNDEVISAGRDDAFSFCEADEYEGFVFRSAGSPDLVPIELLPEWHAAMGEATYELGIVWDFPYLLQMKYEVVASVAVSAFSVSLPLGIAFDNEDALGGGLWAAESFSLAETLTQCLRFCDHPTFDAAGVYQVGSIFREAYPTTCYAPRYPRRGDSGSPLDP